MYLKKLKKYLKSVSKVFLKVSQKVPFFENP